MTVFRHGGPKRYAHQVKALRKILSTRGITALLLDPGLGKTAVVIDYACILALKSPSREARVLVACPLVAIDTWVSQMELWASPDVAFWAESLGGSIRERSEALASRGPNPPAKARQSKKAHPRALHYQKSVAWAARHSDPNKIVQPQQGPEALGDGKPRVILEVVNLDTFSRRDTVGSRTMADVVLDGVLRFQPDLMVVDEMHKIKGTSSNVSQLMARIGARVPRRIGLTGTVMPHSPLDVFAQWRFLDQYAFGERLRDGTVKRATWGSFLERYAVMGGWMGKQVVGTKNLDDMQEVMSLNSVVARKEDALDLPPATDVVIPVELSPAEKKAYGDMKSALATMLANGQFASVSSRLTQMLRLRQITGGHLPDDTGQLHEVGDSKARTIASLVNDTLVGEKRVVIFALFTAEINQLAKALQTEGTEVMVITGGTSQEERVRMRRRFGPEGPQDQRIVMIAQIKTMSLAVNELVTASHAVFASLSQQRDDIVQARDRLNRSGQTRPMTFWFALAPGTVDNVIYQSYIDRTNLEAAVLRHIMGRDDVDDLQSPPVSDETTPAPALGGGS